MIENFSNIPGKLRIALLYFVIFITLDVLTGCYNTPETYQLINHFEVDGRQGICADSLFYYVSGSKSLYKYSKTDLSLIAENVNIFDSLSAQLNHLGDIDIYDNRIYAGAELFVDGRGENLHVLIYDTDSLKLINAVPVKNSDQREISGIAVDTTRRSLLSTDWLDGSNLYVYDLNSFELIKKIYLNPPPVLQQGITVKGNNIFITSDEGDADLNLPDILYSAVIPNEYPDTIKIYQLKEFTEVNKQGEIEGLSFDPSNGNMLVMFNEGMKIIKGVPSGFYNGYTEEKHFIYVYKFEK